MNPCIGEGSVSSLMRLLLVSPLPQHLSGRLPHRDEQLVIAERLHDPREQQQVPIGYHLHAEEVVLREHVAFFPAPVVEQLLQDGQLRGVGIAAIGPRGASSDGGRHCDAAERGSVSLLEAGVVVEISRY